MKLLHDHAAAGVADVGEELGDEGAPDKGMFTDDAASSPVQSMKLLSGNTVVDKRRTALGFRGDIDFGLIGEEVVDEAVVGRT